MRAKKEKFAHSVKILKDILSLFWEYFNFLSKKFLLKGAVIMLVETIDPFNNFSALLKLSRSFCFSYV